MIRLYRKNNNGDPCIWAIEANGSRHVKVLYGILGKTIRSELIPVTLRDTKTEIASKVNDKRKQGYIELSEVKDDIVTPPVEDVLDSPNLTAILAIYLKKYLPDSRSNTNNDTLLPMLAKTYTNNCFKYANAFLGQFKINGLRCIIRATYTSGDMFKPRRLTFQSREGIYWTTLTDLEDYLLSVFPTKFVQRMIDESIALDGEVYLPGHSVNEINHFVKDATCEQNKLLQYWCYDVAIENMIQYARIEYIQTLFNSNIVRPNSIYDHLNNKERFVVLPVDSIVDDKTAVTKRNNYIALGFEGLIMRNPNLEYGFGSRSVKTMLKFKETTDGKFTIVDIYKEPKRNVPILLCRNDINDETFETRLSDSYENQRKVLADKNKYIGTEVFISYGERSGVSRVPFHIKDVTLI